VSNQYDEIILRLIDGETVNLEFQSVEDRNKFRFSIYQAKKRFEEIVIMMDPVYVIKGLQFQVDKENPAKVSMFCYDIQSRKIQFKIL